MVALVFLRWPSATASRRGRFLWRCTHHAACDTAQALIQRKTAGSFKSIDGTLNSVDDKERGPHRIAETTRTPEIVKE